MPSDVKLYRVLIASPSDVADERVIVREQIHRWNALNTETMRVILKDVGWEIDSTPDLQQRGQAVINQQLVDTSDLLIGIFWTRLGTSTPEAGSGTVEEIERFVSQGKRCMVYFSDIEPPHTLEQDQSDRLMSYRQSLQPTGLTGNFKDREEFRKLVFNHITSAIQQIRKLELEDLAAQNTAKITEQALELQPVQHQAPNISEHSFSTLLNAQVSVKQILESKFSLQDMEDIKEREIANIQRVLESPELATLFSETTTETVSAIVQILETATTPSIYIISAICRYGDDSIPEWQEFIADWVERLSVKGLCGCAWVNCIKTYPGLLLLYASGLSSLRSGKTYFLKEISERSIYSRDYDREINLLDILDPRDVFYGEIGQLIESSPNRKYTPVNDHLTTIIKEKLHPNEDDDMYVNWFDCFEFLLSFKSVQMKLLQVTSGNRGLFPYIGSFVWRGDSRRKLIKIIQDAAIEKNKYGIAVSNFIGGKEALEKLSIEYDSVGSKNKFNFGIGGFPDYINFLVESAKKGQPITTISELNAANSVR